MSRLSVGDLAPDFALPDHEGVLVSLEDILRAGNALLVFNLGFL